MSCSAAWPPGPAAASSCSRWSPARSVGAGGRPGPPAGRGRPPRGRACRCSPRRAGTRPAVDWAGVPWVGDPRLGVRMEPGRAGPHRHAAVHLGRRSRAGRRARHPAALSSTVVRHAVAAHPESRAAARRRFGAGPPDRRDSTLAVDWARARRPGAAVASWPRSGWGTRTAAPGGSRRRWPRCAGRSPTTPTTCRCTPTSPPCWPTTAGSTTRWPGSTGRCDRDPEFDCAVHTGHRLRYRADGDLAHLVRLADFQRDHPDESHEHTDLAECCATGRVAEPGAGRGHARAAIRRRSRPPTRRPALSSAQRLLAAGPAGVGASAGRVRRRDRPGAAGARRAARAARLAAGRTRPTAPEVWACLGLLHHGPTSRGRRLDAAPARWSSWPRAALDRITEAALFALVSAPGSTRSARADVAALVSARLLELAAGGEGPGADRPVGGAAGAGHARPGRTADPRGWPPRSSRSYVQPPLRRRRRKLRRRAIR